MDDVVAVEIQRLIAHHRASLTAVTDVDNVAVTAEIGVEPPVLAVSTLTRVSTLAVVLEKLPA